MLKRCCKRDKKGDDANVSPQTKQYLLEEKKRESIERNTKVLREDLYQNYMKPYFKLG